MFKINKPGFGDPGRTRTCYLQIRNLSLYPDELRDPPKIEYNMGGDKSKKNSLGATDGAADG